MLKTQVIATDGRQLAAILALLVRACAQNMNVTPSYLANAVSEVINDERFEEAARAATVGEDPDAAE